MKVKGKKAKRDDFLISSNITVCDDEGNSLNNIRSIRLDITAGEVPVLIIERFADKEESLQLPEDCIHTVSLDGEPIVEQISFVIQNIKISFKKEHALVNK